MPLGKMEISNQTHRTKIKRGCTNLVDVIYEPDVNTMVVLLNGDDVSELYHFDPYANTSYSTVKLDYPYGNLYSIDTVGEVSSINIDMYVAMGDSVFFSQNISNGIAIEESCLEIIKIKVELQETPLKKTIEDPITAYSDDKDFLHFYNIQGNLFYGTRTCDVFHTKY